MTISELIEKLNGFPNKNIDVEILTTTDFGKISYETVNDMYIYTDEYTNDQSLILQ